MHQISIGSKVVLRRAINLLLRTVPDEKQNCGVSLGCDDGCAMMSAVSLALLPRRPAFATPFQNSPASVNI